MTKRILVPLDFSDSSTVVVQTAIRYGHALGAQLELLHVFQDPTYVMPAPLELVTFPIDMERITAEVERRLGLEVETVRAAGLTCESATLMGRPHAEIVAHAEKTGAELIVMGTHGRSGISHAILGSVAERVLHKTHCPVLVVPLPRR